MIKHPRRHLIEIVIVVFLVIYLYPFVIVLINSAKDAFSVTQFPMRLPEKWSQLFINMQTIWTSPNIRYGSSFVSSVLIMVFSLLFVTIFPAMGAWVLVRTKTRTSHVLFLIFVAAMVIPFQIVMFPLVSWFSNGFPAHRAAITEDLLRHRPRLPWVRFISFRLRVPRVHQKHPLRVGEASIIDGCKLPEVFFRIIFPLLTPVHATIGILHGIWIWNDFLLPLLVLGKGNRIQTLPLAVANFAGAYVKQWDLILTAILMAMIPVLVSSSSHRRRS